ncbi:MAG: hypothetical protein KC486_29730, partial [Myxococcales bacterium]|nr:hypothetical protein [Myxococcales bacterium]
MLSPALSLLLSTFVSFSAGPAGDAAPESAATPEPAATARPEPAARGPQATREEQAFRLYQEGRFAEAALEFEALHADFSDPRYLYNAASSRFAVGHYAHAADYLARYLETPGLAADDRGDASGQLSAARGNLRPLRIVVEGPAAGATIAVEHVAELASDIRPPLAVQGALSDAGGEATVALDPGTWRVRVHGAEGAEITGEVAVQGGDATITLTLPAADDQAPVEASMRPYVLGFGVGGGGIAALGLGLTVGTAVRADRLLSGGEACDADPGACRERFVRNLNARAWGTGLAGLGLGAVAGGLSGLIRDPRRRRMAWIIEAATGGALVVAGAVSLGFGARLSSGVTSPSDARWDDFASWAGSFDDESSGGASLHSIGGLLLGLGGGL